MAYAILLSEQAKEEIVAIKKSGDKTTIKKVSFKRQEFIPVLFILSRTGTNPMKAYL